MRTSRLRSAIRAVSCLQKSLHLLEEVSYRGPSQPQIDPNVIPIKDFKARKVTLGPPKSLPFDDSKALRRLCRTVETTSRDLQDLVLSYIDGSKARRVTCTSCGRFVSSSWVLCPMCGTSLYHKEES